MEFDIKNAVFRPATESDILKLHQIARRIVAAGFEHWDDEYPTAEIFREDMGRGELYVADYLGEPIGMICMIFEPSQIESLQNNPDANFSKVAKPAMLCRLGVDPAYNNCGIATMLMAQCEQIAKTLGGELLELLVAQDNPVGLHIYRDKLNYVFKGKTFVYGEDYLAFEKRI